MHQQHWPVTFRIGVATFTSPPASVDVLIQCADQLMYAAKQSRKNAVRHVVFPNCSTIDSAVKYQGKKTMAQILPVGKIPRDILERLLAQAPTQDPRILLRPGIGLDCAVVEVGDTLLVLKSDPITFATDVIGWYVVQVTANDLATTGATPRWLMVTMLLPEARTTAKLVERISQDVYRACREIGVMYHARGFSGCPCWTVHTATASICDPLMRYRLDMLPRSSTVLVQRSSIR